MPYPRPPDLPGHYYHFYNRGRSRLPIFLEEDNYRFVLHKIHYYLPVLELNLIADCLLPNHYHFLVRQDGEHEGVFWFEKGKHFDQTKKGSCAEPGVHEIILQPNDNLKYVSIEDECPGRIADIVDAIDVEGLNRVATGPLVQMFMSWPATNPSPQNHS